MLPQISTVIKTALFFLIPFSVLLAFMYSGYTPQLSAAIAILSGLLLLFFDINLNFSWKTTKTRIVKQLDESISTKKRKLESAKEEVKMLSVGREKTENYKKLLSEYQNVCSEIQNIDKELLVLRKNDPKVLDEIKANIDIAKTGINRWTDNTFQLQSMLKKKHGMASKDVSKALKINDDYDYV